MAVELLVDGLPRAYTEADLQGLFEHYGPVSSVQIVRGPGGESLRFGYVTMTTVEDADKARMALNARPVGSGALIVIVQKRNEP